MATTFDVLHLGNFASIDPTEGNEFAENASVLVGETIGGPGAPVYNTIRSFSPGTTGFAGGQSAVYEQDNTVSNDTFSIDGAADQTFDAVNVYNITLTYTDGTTATITGVVFQDTAGNTYLAPETTNNADQAALEAKPIESLSIDSFINSPNNGLTGDRVAGNYVVEDSVDGAETGEVMDVGYADAQGDQITNDANSIRGNGGDDSINGGAGADTVDGGEGSDVIFGEAGDDSLSGGGTGANADTIYGGDGNDVISGGTGTANDSLYGGDGNDSITGNAGDDLIYGDEFVLSLNDTGTNGYASTSSFNDMPTTEVTYEITFASTTPGTTNTPLMSYAVGSSHNEMLLDITNGGDTLRLHTHTNSPIATVDISSLDLFDGNAHSVAFTWDSSTGAVEFFVDGVSVGTSNSASGALSSGGTFVLGQDQDTEGGGFNSGEIFQGEIYEANLWSDIRTSEEIAADADSLWVDGTDPNLVANWTPDPETGGMTNTQGGNDLTLSGAASIENSNSGNDSIDGGTGDDTIFAGDGSDTIVMSDGFGNDVIVGGEGGIDADFVDLSALSGPVTVTYSGDEAGTITDGTDTITFSEIENLILTDQADVVDATNDTAGTNIDAGAGNDTIEYGQGSSTVLGGDGNDLIDDGAGAAYFGTDSLDGGAGQDTIYAGFGDDTIIGGADNDLLYGEGDNDSITGDGGSDTIFGGFGADTISGGAGADYLGGDEGDDSIGGDAGNDTILGGAGADTIDGGDDYDVLSYWSSSSVNIDLTDGSPELGGEAQGDVISNVEEIDGSNTGDDTITVNDDVQYVFGYGGNDSLTGSAAAQGIGGGAGDDFVDGGGGNDTLTGDSGADTVIGGAGDDSITGGADNDSLTGGVGDDTFSYSIGDGADTITDFNAGSSGTLSDGDNTNNDFINLSAFYDNLQELYADQADDGILNQSNTTDAVGRAVDYSDNSEFGAGDSLTFQGATADNSSFTTENTGVVCFAAGTMILTDKGEVPVERLRVEDRIVTYDNGLQPLAMLAARSFGPEQLSSNPELKPIEIKPGALGGEQRLVVSPQHMMLVRHDGEETFVRARQLSRLKGGAVRVMNGCRRVTYFHLVFSDHQIVFANKRPAESFFPGQRAIAALDADARREFELLFPDIIDDPIGPTPPKGWKPARSGVLTHYLPKTVAGLRGELGHSGLLK